MVELINCERCGKQIEKKGRRVYCIPCRKEVDKEIAIAYRKANIEKIRERGRQIAKAKRDALKREE